MNILEKAITLENYSLQIEYWSEDYSLRSYGSTIGAYPRSNHSINKQFSPKIGQTFRFQLDFDSYEDAKEAFDNLQTGKTKLNDYTDNYTGQKEFLACL